MATEELDGACRPPIGEHTHVLGFFQFCTLTCRIMWYGGVG
jgi:hypothetical protein